jgi:NAD(P)-dependent dehydrogenase (short-subunit alcohol dehydrogenase family)
MSIIKKGGLQMIVVAGSEGLIGKEVVKELKDRGKNVYGIDPLNKEGNNYDIMDFDEVESLVDIHCVTGFVNCAYPIDYIEHIVCFVSATNNFAYSMAHKNGGSIVNFASIYGLVGPDWKIYVNTKIFMPCAYAAAKGAIIAHSRCVATEYANEGVRVNCIAPGGVYDGQDDLFVANYSARVPMGRMAKPDDISSVVAFLLSEDSKYITGTCIPVDGGYVNW